MKNVFSILTLLTITNWSIAQGGMDFNSAQENYILTPDNAAIDLVNNFTIECWIQPRVIADAMMLFQKGTCNDYSFVYSLQIRPDSTVMFGCNTTSGSCDVNNAWQTTTKLIPGECVHLAVTYSAPGPVIYFDGVAQPGTYFSGSFGGNINTCNKPLQTGIYTNYSGDEVLGFNGTMDELRIWSVVRTPAELIAGMSGQLTGTETDLELYYNFNSFVAGDNAIITNMASTGAALNGTVSSLNSTTPAPGSGACFSSIESYTQSAVFKIYPNPSEGEVFFELANATGEHNNLLLTIMSIDGRVVSEQQMNTTPYLLDSRNFACGTYQYVITEGSAGIISTGTLIFN